MTDSPHHHCSTCVSSACTEASCPVVICPNACGFTLHPCKLEDHLLLCPLAEVPCSNAAYGCTTRMSRYRIRIHLAHCPASVVPCKFSWERRSVDVDAVEEKDTPSVYDKELLEADMHVLHSHSPSDTGINLGIGIEYGKTNHIYGPKVDRPGNIHEVQVRLEKSNRVSYPEYSSSRKVPPKEEIKYVFWCSCVVRRDEVQDHYLWHNVHVGLDGTWYVQHCPLHRYGCPFVIQRLLPRPAASRVVFDKNTHVFTMVPPLSDVPTPFGSFEGNYMALLRKKQELSMYGYESDEPLDPLSQLPAQIIRTVVMHLDSFSLLNLSQVSHYFRGLCSSLVRVKGVVEIDWIKEERHEMYQRWKKGNIRVSQVTHIVLTVV